ncbi:MAG: DMT family transporter [Actinomycetota bacterium]|nr:DMT family transporter [Actinomycetota bacterium]
MSDSHAWKGEPRTWAAIIVALLLWAAAFAGIRAGLESYGPGQVALLRFGTASLVLLGYAVVTRMHLPDIRDLPTIALGGFLGITIYHVSLNFGEQTVTAGAAALLISASPIFTALMSSAWLKERLTVWGWTGVVVSFAGVMLITFGEGGSLAFEPGALLILVAAVATSAFFIVSKRTLKRYNALEYTTYAIWAGTLPMLVFAPGLVQQFPSASPESTLAVVFLGIFPGAISYVLWSHALSRMPASVLSTFLYFQPINATWIAWVWLGEMPAMLAFVGGAISLVGVAIVNTKGTSRD